MEATKADDPHAEDPRGGLLSALATAIVQATREYTGRGPTKARASFSGEMLVVVMQDSLTKGERSLADSGKTDMVVEIRRCFQSAMSDELVGIVEQLTGRKVLAFMSDHHVAPDMGVVIFVLAPRPGQA